MEFFKTNTKIPFMSQRKFYAIFSALVFILSLVSLYYNNLNLGLDFTGGSQIDIAYTKKVDVNAVRQSLVKQFPKVQVQRINEDDLRIRVANTQLQGDSDEGLKNAMHKLLPAGFTIIQANAVGPTVGKQLLTNGILAVVFSLIFTMIYIALRFEYKFAISAALALIHDPVLILGVFSFFHLEFNMVVLTAVLTVIGYSLNDTIVVYDRVRENFRKMRKSTPKEIMDASINQTLSRTIMTSGLTLIVVVILYFYGGDVVHGFSLALIIGIVIGTYSSIYVAGSLAIAFGLNKNSLLPRAKREFKEGEELL
jgi:preprotein translocase subunit SecF